MRFLLFLSLLLCVNLSFAHPDTSYIRKVIEQYVQTDGFSGTILLAQSGEPIFHQSYGLANRSLPDTIQNDYHYSIASVTKLFTAIRILQLVEEEKLRLHEPAQNYLPSLSAQLSDKITLHSLLLHLSGLPQEKDRDYLRPLPPEAFLKKILSQKSKNTFGSFNYNNTDYLLLGLLIEAVSGESWEENIRKHILQPLGMKNTGFLAYGNYPDDFAYSHSIKKGELQEDPLFYIENFYAAGSMYATTTDLLLLDQALYSNSLLKEKSRSLLAKSYPEYNYAGYGVWNYQYPFIKEQPTIMERRGGILGANVVLVRISEQNYTLIILSNDERFNPDSFGDDKNLRELLIRALFKEAKS